MEKNNTTEVSLEDKLSILSHLDGTGLKKGYKGMNLNYEETRPVYQFSKEGILLLEHASKKEVMELFGIKKDVIERALDGVIRTAGGYRWSYDRYIN